jgi:hypothetical protein
MMNLDRPSSGSTIYSTVGTIARRGNIYAYIYGWNELTLT